MAVAFYIVLAYLDSITPENVRAAWEAPATDPRMLKAFALIGIELLLVTAVALFFSTFSSPMLSAALTFAVYVIGQFSADLRNLGAVLESPAAGTIARGLYYVLPNMAALNVRTEVVHALPVTAEHMLWASASSFLYIGALLVAAMIVFSRRDFK